MSHQGPPPTGPQGPQWPQGSQQGAAAGGVPPQGPSDGVWTIHQQEQPQPPKRSKLPVIIAISTGVALIAAGGGFAFVQADPFNLFGSGPQPAEVLPANAFAYAAVDLDPTAAQKVDAIRFLNHFPAFTDNVGLSDERDDVREDIFTEAFEELDCSEVNYSETIEPWLGFKLGVGALANAGGREPDVVVAVEVTDVDAAQKGLEALNRCSTGEPVGFAFTGDYVLLAESRDIAQQSVADAEDEALADDADFKADMNSLGDIGIASGWMDVGKLVAELPSEELPDQADLEALSQAAGRYAATFRFDHDKAELVSSVFSDYADVETGSNPVVELPGDTAFAMSASGGAKQLEANWDKVIESARSNGVDVEAALADFENETGFSIPGDVETLLGDNLLIAVSSEGLTAEAIESGDFEEASGGVRFTGDADKLQDLYDRLVSYGRDTFGVELPVSKVDFEDGLVIATNDEYAETLSTLDGSLGDSSTFTSVVEDAANQDGVLYLDFDAIEDVVIQSMESQGSSDEDIANVKPLRAFGITAGIEDGYAISTARLSVND